MCIVKNMRKKNQPIRVYVLYPTTDSKRQTENHI